MYNEIILDDVVQGDILDSVSYKDDIIRRFLVIENNNGIVKAKALLSIDSDCQLDACLLKVDSICYFKKNTQNNEYYANKEGLRVFRIYNKEDGLPDTYAEYQYKEHEKGYDYCHIAYTVIDFIN